MDVLGHQILMLVIPMGNFSGMTPRWEVYFVLTQDPREATKSSRVAGVAVPALSITRAPLLIERGGGEGDLQGFRGASAF
jgi:hypothetical protein